MDAIDLAIPTCLYRTLDPKLQRTLHTALKVILDDAEVLTIAARAYDCPMAPGRPVSEGWDTIVTHLRLQNGGDVAHLLRLLALRATHAQAQQFINLFDRAFSRDQSES